MKYFDLQFGKIPREKNHEEIAQVGFFANKFLILRNSFDGRWYRRHHLLTILLKGLFMLSVFVVFLLGAVLIVDISTSSFTLIRYFTLFSEHSIVIHQLYVYLSIALLTTLLLSYILFWRSYFKYNAIGKYHETITPPSEITFDDIAPSSRVDLWDSLDDDAKKVMLMSLDCAHFWGHPTLGSVHILKCLALYCGHAQHVFLRFGVDVPSFTRHLHDEMSRILPHTDWDATYMHILLSRAYKISVESGERCVSSLSLFEALIAHDALVREIFEDMGINFEDVVSLIELERVHVRHEQFSFMSTRVFGMTRHCPDITIPVVAMRKLVQTYATQKILYLDHALVINNHQALFLVLHANNLFGYKRRWKRLLLDRIVKKFGLIKSFVRVRKIIDVNFNDSIIFIEDGVYLPLITTDETREYSLLTYFKEVSHHLDSALILTQQTQDAHLVNHCDLLEIPVVSLEIDESVMKLLIAMEMIMDIETKFRILFAYDALLAIAFELTPATYDEMSLTSTQRSLTHALSLLERREKRILVTKDVLQSLLAR
ncbi:hypothetical protein IT409_01595 [Candidatus Falkowbacteria bacterium]|nr:hypothetical protein [Candidatus Falkowbacteria bacterium]